MKKLNLLQIVSMLAVALLAANPPGKLVRLEIINASGESVYMKLEGHDTGAFYYLTIPNSTTRVFTVLVDSYSRTTWACNGITTHGSLVMTGNTKLKFVLCGSFPLRTVWHDLDYDGQIDDTHSWVDDEYWRAPNFGEATQEKVVYWQGFMNYYWTTWNNILCGVPGCKWWWWSGAKWQEEVLWVKIKLNGIYWGSVKFPRGVLMRYQY
jgi:hypothetical protein